MSSAEAVITCTVSEYRWCSSLGRDDRFFGCTRYMDDASGVVAFVKNNPISFQRAVRILDSFKSECYPDGLVLEEEKIELGEFRFLEAMTSVKGCSISSRYFCKNLETICKEGKQKFYTIQSSQSFSSKQTKFGVLVARLIAIQKAIILIDDN